MPWVTKTMTSPTGRGVHRHLGQLQIHLPQPVALPLFVQGAEKWRGGGQRTRK